MYKLKYNFLKYNQDIRVYLEDLINKSISMFKSQLRNGQIKKPEKDASALAGCIRNVEEYLYYYFVTSPEDFNSILNSMMNNVRTIACFPSNKRRIYGETQAQNKLIYINPELEASKTLSGEERTRLYMAHELGHIINHEWMKKVIDYTDGQIRTGALPQKHAQLIYEGFAMLDEATTQDRAEDFVYSFSGKARPQQLNVRNRRLFNGKPYKSNFDYYGELQAPATMFARTLRGIGKENDDTKALELLSKRALSPDFFDNILGEYTKDRQMPAFIEEFKYMGLLKRASYANFGAEDISYCRNSSIYLSEFSDIASQMRDCREPYINSNARNER